MSSESNLLQQYSDRKKSKRNKKHITLRNITKNIQIGKNYLQKYNKVMRKQYKLLAISINR